MSQPQKSVPPPLPFRYPFPLMPMTVDKLKAPQPNLAPNLPQNSGPIPNNMAAPPFAPPRMYNPYFNGYGMYPMPQMGPFPPFAPMMRNTPLNVPSPQNSKNSKDQEQRMMPPRPFFGRPLPPFFNPNMFMPPALVPQLPPTEREPAKTFNKLAVTQTVLKPVEKEQKKEVKPIQSSSSQTPIPRQQSKSKAKEPRHANINPYEPQPPKKKKKKQIIHIDTNFQRETREKKQSIEKMMDLIMKERPLRDRVIKIGKQYQAYIPEFFVNQFQYNLKIKLQKKQNLMSRLITSTS